MRKNSPLKLVALCVADCNQRTDFACPIHLRFKSIFPRLRECEMEVYAMWLVMCCLGFVGFANQFLIEAMKVIGIDPQRG